MSQSTGLVTLTIDGAGVTVPKGTLIIRAAEQAGVFIPRFCDHPLLEPVAACRQCLVEVAAPAGPKGELKPFPKPQPACAIECAPGMVVKTQLTSQVAAQAQAQVMELVLINHPLDCPVCDKGGECPLQNQARTTGRAVSRFAEPKNTFPKPLALTSALLLDRERCVLCQRCTRFAAQIPGDPFIALQKRGSKQQIGRFDPEVLGVAPVEQEPDAPPLGQAVDGQPFAGYFSGNVIQICPVGALTSKDYQFRARPFDLVSTDSVAEHDSSGSAIRVDYRRGVVLRRLAGNDPELNQEWLTDKDRFGYKWQSLDRLTQPMRRQDGVLEETSWPDALAQAAHVLAHSKSHGVLPGGRLTLEDAFAYGVFARQVLKTDNIDFRARPYSAEEAQFLAHFVAGSGQGVGMQDLAAAPAVLLVGFEPEEEGGVVYLRLRQAMATGQKVFSIAPLASRGLRRLAGQLVPAAPGYEAEVLAGLDQKAKGLAGEVAKALSGGVIVVGERLATSPGAYSEALAVADRLGARMVWIPRRAGERAALEAGLLPGLAMGGHLAAVLDAETATSLYGQAELASGGRSLTGILQAAAAGEIDTLLVGGLELSDLPDPALAIRAFESAKVVALQVQGSQLAPYADVMLPVAPPAEKPGTYINFEGRFRPFGQVLVSNVPSDALVLQRLGEKLEVGTKIGPLSSAHEALRQLGAPTGRPPAPNVKPAALPNLPKGQVLLSTWRYQLDESAGVAGEGVPGAQSAQAGGWGS
ncbi:MAG: NADH-quinone oxidoreductase subunit G, partial [Micrococcales bacterium]|nr:NADH-quinone oxidoreductase subunit G [Micrococcales bacterium]